MKNYSIANTNNFGIYNSVPELLSVSLGSAEATLVKLTYAYCSFVNGGKLVTPIFVDRIQDSEGNTIFNSEKRICKKCEKISFSGNEYESTTLPSLGENKVVFTEELPRSLPKKNSV